MATVRDVAKRANVSPITVSRVINQSGYFSEEARMRVEAAIDELGYVPNRLARSLRSKRTNVIALVLTDITNPFFTTLARSVEDAASDAGFMVIICNTDESEVEEQKNLHTLLQQQVDGILLVPACSTSASVDLIQKQKTPVVVLDRRMPAGTEVDIVRGDSEGGAYQLIQLLIGLGHKRIAVLSGPRDVSTAQDRVAGYQRAMCEADLEAAANLVYYGGFTQPYGYEMAQRALSANPRPTALFATNNFIAIGCLKALQDAGLRVPEDIAIVSFDDLPSTLITFPFFTVAAQPAYEMAKKATQLLLARLNGEASAACQEIVLPTEIIVRQSSGQPQRSDPGKG